MAAAATDKFRKVARRWVAQVGSGGISDDTSTTGPLSTTSGLPTDTACDITFDRVDTEGTETATLEETVTGVVSGSNLTDMIRGQEGTAQAHTAGKVAENLLNAKTWNDLIDGILVGHTQAGGHKPTIIYDANGNEVLKFTATASAVNEVTFTNNATGSNPVVSATGGDSNVGMDFKPKGTGSIRIPTECSIYVVDGASSLTTGDGKYYFTVPPCINGMNLVSVHARVVTAGTTNTTDIQIANVTDSTDMLSTKLTIDTGETGSDTAATAAVIDTTKDDVATNDLLRIDIDAVSTTAPKGLIVRLGFALP